MRKRLIALILLVTVPLLFGIAWFMSERSFTLSLEREKTRIQATQGVVFRDVQQTMQSLTYLEAVAYARQYTQYYHAQGIDLIFCWRGNPIADALLPNRYYDGLICGQRAAMLDTGSRPQRYAVAEPVNSNLTVILLGDVGDIYALKDTFRRMAFAVAGGASALLILLALILAGVLTRPLRKLTEAARAMTTQSNTTVPLPTGQKDEIGTLARAFSEMQGAVEARETRLREESEARQALLEALAHEMRTPLTSLLGNARLLEQELPQEERKRIADSMAKEIHRLTDMDQQLMKLTAMGHEPPEAERVSVTELLRETAERLQPQADGITIAVEGADSAITGDRELLSLLADNLAANAIHASSTGMMVILRAEPNGFTVQDQGIGMSEETLRHACEPFWKADKARTRRQGGAGLGLALCRQIAELHGGSLTFSSSPGQGTAVTFTTPLHPDDDSVTYPVA